MLNYTKIPDASLDFQVAVTRKGVKIVSPQIGLKINLEAMPQRDRLLEGTANAAYHYCRENNIPVDGNIFVILSCDKALEKGGNFKVIFVPEPALRH